MDTLEASNIANRIDLENRLNACSNTPFQNLRFFPFTLQKYSFFEGQEIWVVRDDLLCGGSKSRILHDFLRSDGRDQYKEYVYISPWFGGAQIALPWILKLMQMEDGIQRTATIIMDWHPFGLQPYAEIAKAYGANIIEIPPNGDKFRFAEDYAKIRGALYLKPGFDYPEVVNLIADLGREIKKEFGTFDECWAPVGSGTLIRGLQEAELADKYFGVCIFNYCPDIGNAEGIVYPKGHNMPADFKELPPFPSATRYDAKVWRYIRNRRGKILLWNVM